MELTQDAFLGGKLSVWQPRHGYRAGVDPVLLAAFVAAVPGQSVLELGCGAGVAALALMSRVGGLKAVGLELQPDYADLARRNAAGNSLPLQVLTGDLTQMPVELRARQFDHVIANPPYHRRTSGTPASDRGRATALAEDAPLRDWIDAAARRLAPGGRLSVIQKADRLPDLLAACDDRLGEIRILPLLPRAGRDASLVLLGARKGGRGAFRLLAPVVLHDGESHGFDGEDYAAPIRAILREGAGFSGI